MDRRRARALVIDGLAGGLIVAGVAVFAIGFPGGAAGTVAIAPQLGVVSVPALAGAQRPIVDPQVGAVRAGEPGIVADRLRIPRLAIDSPIVEGDAVSVPLHAVAHYPGTAWTGGGSNIYLYGHARAGLFRDLWKARDGDTIVLHLVNGSEATYRVVRIVPLAPWDALEYLAPSTSERLTLQTCIAYDERSPRFIVIADRVPEA